MTATQILLLIGISINLSPSFSRKFELISGWSVLKTVLPYCWDPSVNEAAIDILLGRLPNHIKKTREGKADMIMCPHIVPAIFCSLQHGLVTVANTSQTSEAPDGAF